MGNAIRDNFRLQQKLCIQCLYSFVLENDIDYKLFAKLQVAKIARYQYEQITEKFETIIVSIYLVQNI